MQDSQGTRDPLQLYFESIRPIPLLTRDETAAVARRRVAHETAFRRGMCALPATAVALVDHWSERKRAGFVTGVLAAGYRDDRGRDWSRQVDETLGAVAVMLDRRSGLGRRRDPAARRERAALDRQIARRVADADPSLDELVSLGRHFEEVVSASGAAAAQQKLGLLTRAARARLGHVQRALAGREEAVRSLVRHNLKLVVKFAKRYRGLGLPFLDLIQEGNLGLLRAAEKFDPARGFTLSTYGVWWIEQAVVRAIQNHARTVRVPAHVYDRQLRYRAVARELRQCRGREPTRAELAAALDLSTDDVELVVASARRIRSTHETLPGTDDLTLEELLADPQATDVVDGIDRYDVGRALDRAMRCLRPRERQILEWRFGLAGGPTQTLEEIGNRIGLSRERVRQIQAAALARLRGGEDIEGLAASIGLALPGPD